MTVVRAHNAIVRWKVPRTDGASGHVLVSAFRGMLVDIPDDQASALLESGAVVPAEERLERGGSLAPLPTKGSDEELRSWASDATAEEIEEACAANPEIADRIRAARRRYEENRAAESALSGGLPEGAVAGTGAQAGGADEEDSSSSTAPAAATDDDTPAPATGEDSTGADDLLFSNEDLDAVVVGNVQAVRDFLAANPAQASRVLEAESRRATAAGEAVRKGVEYTVQTIVADATS